ncbi:hypothetical protein KC19_VG102200 [Ceratodon purpureus]|uniref:Uncharacterized protein n=1 Tax=Ceratodon purpureus TaxID=3225 RepID=A0A8T0HPG7_CERPU|nr:hypothetical protein KC19_VG102200 [Ceratodon purpureus]
MHRTDAYGDVLAAMWWAQGPSDPTLLRKHCDEVTSKIQYVREDVDVGWGMLGLDNVPYPPPSLKKYVDKAVQALMDLREKELELTFQRLGYKGAQPSIDLAHLDIPFCSQLISSQTF